ncbi:hypothetical protein E2C01_080810 [Portunus trituberculatus]|uniref:Uncharacterized protein n=1 Tax=Portunus trituberculatus TaxID=210409 RepID=A0A5B7IZC0_PORTR|nr:hypothetical protein [Portunus trituberculatus]
MYCVCRVFSNSSELWQATERAQELLTLENEQYTDLHLFIAGAGHSWADRCTETSVCVLSSAMVTINIGCKGCELDYWEIIAPAVPVEDDELDHNLVKDDPQPGPSSSR